MKFGKQIQKKQLEIPEYAASFVDYKALKKLIKELKNSPATRPNAPSGQVPPHADPQSILQANRAPFFFQLDRELDKVTTFYNVKESESKVRLKVLLDKQRAMRMRTPVISNTSTNYITLEQGFRDFIKDLSKLQQFIEINATAFSKILKKWDKTSKSQTKELYLSRAVEIQPCFNQDVISELSDQASSALLDCAAWAEGDSTHYGGYSHSPHIGPDETDSDILDALSGGDLPALRTIIKHLGNLPPAGERLTKAFLTAVSSAPDDALKLLLETDVVDLHSQDEINGRTCLHKSAMAGRRFFIQVGLAAGVDPLRVDAYGRIALHYACMNGHADLIQDLVEAAPESVETQDLDGFTSLIHAIVHSQYGCVEKILSYSPRVDPEGDSHHVPLNLACQHGCVPVIKLLLQTQPQILPDAEGLYPQHLVARFGRDVQILLLLKDYGADLDQPDKLYQWTPLFHAASEGHLECLEMLLRCGVNPSSMDEKNLSALYYATWEGHLQCMATLARVNQTQHPIRALASAPATQSMPQTMTSVSVGGDIDLIPDLSLPPPIIPTRRYGHNFLGKKVIVMIIFDEASHNAVTFYDETKYPAARLTIAPMSVDVISRNILLPIQDENKCVSFEMDDLTNFAVDFHVFPTFGKKVLAKGSAPPEVFRDMSNSSGYRNLALLDPRLRTVGQICFRFQVIKPFAGLPLDITPFVTYWKATSQLNSRPSSFVTGSSLSGNCIRLSVQLTRDGVPIIYPRWKIAVAGLDFPVLGLMYEQFVMIANHVVSETRRRRLQKSIEIEELPTVQATLAESFMSLEFALDMLPVHLSCEIHLLYPTPYEEDNLRLGPTLDINGYADSLLRVVFQHARQTHEQIGHSMRSIVFSSYNKDLCTALNWKQPNYPVLLCNDLGAQHTSSTSAALSEMQPKPNAFSIKEAVRIAQTNNFMGLMCRSQLFDLVPALVEAIKVAGLILVSDASDTEQESRSGPASPPFGGVPDGVDGILARNLILRFRESIDV